MSYLKSMATQLSGLQLKAEYWDVRAEDIFETQISIVNGEVTSCTASPSVGAFVRVRKSGFWFYESTTDLNQIKAVLLKLDAQEPLTSNAHPYELEMQEPYINLSFANKKFSAVSMERKLLLVQKYESFLREQPKVSNTRVVYKDIYKVKTFISSVGTQFEYDFNQGGTAVTFSLKDGENRFDDHTLLYGSEFSELENREGEIRDYVTESAQFLSAPAIEPGKYKVLLDAEVAGVFTHESFGHKSEADFMIGNAEALADWSLGKKIGADCLTIVDYGGHAGTSGYCPIDDDGIPAQKNYLIKNGILTGRLHSVATAGQLNEKPTGNSRALSFEWEPMVRMTSTYIEPGTEKLSEILKRSEGALLVNGVKHGSGLSTFTIAPSRGYMIGKNGEKKPVRVTVLSGSVFETLKNVEAVSSDFHLHSSAIGGCGKMEQWPLPVADGGPFVLIKEMQVS